MSLIEAEPRTLPRRKILEGLVKGPAVAAALASTAVGALVARESLSLDENGMMTASTPYARISLLLENHAVGISDKLLPEGPVDFHWEDYVYREGKIFDPNPQTLVSGVCCANTRYPVGRLLNELAEKGSTLCFGDVKTAPTLEQADSDYVAKALLEAAPLIGLQWLKQRAKRLGDTDEPPFLLKDGKWQKALDVGAWAVAVEPVTALANWLTSVELRSQEYAALNALKNLVYRVHGLESNLRPEFPYIFFRNALWSAKWLEILETNKPWYRKTVGTMKEGNMHAGVKDLTELEWLGVGREAAHLALSLYSPDYIKHLVELNGVDDMCSTRLISLDTDRFGDWRVTDDVTFEHQELRELFVAQLETA